MRSITLGIEIHAQYECGGDGHFQLEIWRLEKEIKYKKGRVMAEYVKNLGRTGTN